MPDPDELLGQIRNDILKWEKAIPYSDEEWGAAERVTSAIAALDKHLSEGGAPPTAWLSAPLTQERATTILGAEPVAAEAIMLTSPEVPEIDPRVREALTEAINEVSQNVTEAVELCVECGKVAEGYARGRDGGRRCHTDERRCYRDYMQSNPPITGSGNLMGSL